MAQILCFGDSITYGMWDSAGGWVTRIRKTIDKKIADSDYLEWHEVFNLGVSGNFTTDLLVRLEPELKARLLIEPKSVAIIGIGINDTKFGKNETVSTPQKYLKQLGQIQKILAGYTKEQIYLGLTPVDENIYGSGRWLNKRQAFSNKRIQEFDNELIKHCRAFGAIYIPLFDEFLQAGHINLLQDGIHPNNAGHSLIAKLVEPVVLKKI